MPRPCAVEVHDHGYIASNVTLHGASPWHLYFRFWSCVSWRAWHSTGQARGIYFLRVSLQLGPSIGHHTRLLILLSRIDGDAPRA